jgi:hypothetical protein
LCIKKILPVLIVLTLFSSASTLTAALNRRVLVYFFKNITGEEDYTELNYQIPLYFYSMVNSRIEGKKFILIDREGLEVYRKDRTRDIWDENVLLNIAKRRNIDDIIYGIFYVQNDKPVIMGKIFHAKSGLLLDITEKETDYHGIFKELESLTIEEIVAFDNEFEEEKLIDYNPKLSRIVQSDIKDTWFFLQGSMGPYFPLGDWADLYPTGYFSELTFLYFPKMNIARLGIGVNANLVKMERKGSATLVDSRMNVFSAGGSIQYSFRLGKFFETILLDLNIGAAQSYIVQSNVMNESTDLYIKTGVNLVLNPINNLHLSLKAGVFSVDYKINPMDALFCEIGFMGF